MDNALADWLAAAAASASSGRGECGQSLAAPRHTDGQTGNAALSLCAHVAVRTWMCTCCPLHAGLQSSAAVQASRLHSTQSASQPQTQTHSHSSSPQPAPPASSLHFLSLSPCRTRPRLRSSARSSRSGASSRNSNACERRDCSNRYDRRTTEAAKTNNATRCRLQGAVDAIAELNDAYG